MRRKIAILGGGISGLTAAYFFKKYSNAEITLFESQNKLGGWIQTIEKDGFLFELGPHSLRISDNDETMALLQELGLEILFADANAKNRYLFLDGKLQKMPSGIFSLLKHPMAKVLLPALCKEPFVSRGKGEESIGSFFARRFSPEIVDFFLDPLVKGIYGGDPHQLSLQCCFPSMAELERRYGSILLGQLLTKQPPTKIITLKHGMSSLIQALGQSVASSIRLNTPIKRLRFQEKKVVVTHDKEEVFDYLFSALPASQLANILEDKQFAKIPYASFAIVHMGFHKLRIPCEGFGYLVPSKEKQDILGTVFDSSIFPGQNLPRMTVMMGGWQKEQLLQLKEEQLYSIALENLSRHLQQPLKPDAYLITKLHNAVPQYLMGHQQIVEDIKRKYPITFLGSSFHGVSVSDCISQTIRICKDQINFSN